MSDALGLAALFGVSIALLPLLTVAATRSRAIVEGGRFLTTRPQEQRFISIALGGHMMGAFLDFGAVSRMSSLIQRAARVVSAKQTADLERRQLSAPIRCFSRFLLWAPTTLSHAVLPRLFTGVDHGRLVVPGKASAGR